jgi:transcriptional regulator with XRE-family HTH domain
VDAVHSDAQFAHVFLFGSPENNSMKGTNGNKGASELDMDLDREVIRCKTCGLVQYRNRVGNCRRCLRPLPPKVEFLIPPGRRNELQGDDGQLSEKWPNCRTVEKIGQRIQQLRESQKMTPKQLHARSRVSRSYLSRIESGQMTPSLGTLEKISQALGVGLNCFFVPLLNGERLLDDPFVRGLCPFLRQLDWEQWQSILERLAAISAGGPRNCVPWHSLSRLERMI